MMAVLRAPDPSRHFNLVTSQSILRRSLARDFAGSSSFAKASHPAPCISRRSTGRPQSQASGVRHGSAMSKPSIRSSSWIRDAPVLAQISTRLRKTGDFCGPAILTNMMTILCALVSIFESVFAAAPISVILPDGRSEQTRQRLAANPPRVSLNPLLPDFINTIDPERKSCLLPTIAVSQNSVSQNIYITAFREWLR
jgi:hypothetical protein